MASIALRQYPIDKIPIKLSAHNYLVLYDNQGNLVAELHGLAQDPVTGGYKEFGRSSDYLRGVPYDVRAGETSGLNQLGQNERVLWQGPGTAERWQTANDALDAINRRGLTYNFSGGDLNGPRDWDSPAPPVIAGN
ncbi:MAG: hypothetical protein JO339_11020, partial [Alphaproteobacteria bacterium]|nr:hypothetical protein [Alphaproteobacteria bacterium]